MDSLEEFEKKATFISKLKADNGFGAIGKVSLQTAQVSLSSVQFQNVRNKYFSPPNTTLNRAPNTLSIRPVTVFSGFRSHCQKSHRILWQDPQDFNKMVNFSSVFLFLILGTKVYNSLPTRWRPGCPELPRVEMRGKKLEAVTGTVLYLQPEGVGLSWGLSFSVIKVLCQRESLFLPTWHLN